MKEKIKKILLWIVLIFSTMGFAGNFIDVFTQPMSKKIYSIGGLIIFGWLILKLQKKLNLPNLFKRKRKNE